MQRCGLSGKISRRKSRENAFIILFSSSFGTDLNEVIEVARSQEDDHAADAFGEMLLQLYAQHTPEVDAAIEAHLKDWKLARLPKVSLAILRISAAEMLFGDADMDSVIINEAVETAKRFGDEMDYQFINGVLGSISRGKIAQGEALPVADGDLV